VKNFALETAGAGEGEGIGTDTGLVSRIPQRVFVQSRAGDIQRHET